MAASLLMGVGAAVRAMAQGQPPGVGGGWRRHSRCHRRDGRGADAWAAPESSGMAASLPVFIEATVRATAHGLPRKEGG